MFAVFILERTPDAFGNLHHASERDKRDLRLLIYHLRLTVIDRLPVFLETVICQTSRIPDGDRVIETDGELEHIRKLPFILGCHDRHVRDRRQIRHVKYSLVGLSVGTYYSCPVYRKCDRQILNADIMYDLIICSLQERRVYGNDRRTSACRQTSGKGHCMFFRYSHIKKALGKLSGEPLQSCSVRHGCGYGADLGVSLGKL